MRSGRSFGVPVSKQPSAGARALALQLQGSHASSSSDESLIAVMFSQ